jgi:hypothetical protein
LKTPTRWNSFKVSRFLPVSSRTSPRGRCFCFASPPQVANSSVQRPRAVLLDWKTLISPSGIALATSLLPKSSRHLPLISVGIPGPGSIYLQQLSHYRQVSINYSTQRAQPERFRSNIQYRAVHLASVLRTGLTIEPRDGTVQRCPGPRGCTIFLGIYRLPCWMPE